MLIRSQDKERLMDFTRASVGIDHGESDENGIWITMMYSERDCGMLGRYSNEQKALKVMDMIHEAYMECETLKNVFGGIGCAFLHNSEKQAFENLKEKIKFLSVFQMPEDSEVEA